MKKTIISWFLVFSMLLGTVPVLAIEDDESSDTITDISANAENLENREKVATDDEIEVEQKNNNFGVHETVDIVPDDIRENTHEHFNVLPFDDVEEEEYNFAQSDTNENVFASTVEEPLSQNEFGEISLNSIGAEEEESNGFVKEIPEPNFPDESNQGNVYSGDIEINEDAFQLRLNSDNSSYSVVGYLGSGSTMDIPAEYKGLPVTKISEFAFQGKSNLQYVTIPNSVIYIGTGAFSGCDNLTYSDVSDNINYLGNMENPFLYLVSVKDNSVSSLTISENTKIIAAYAFENCNNVAELTVPNSVVQIGFKAFRHMDSLTSISLPFMGETGYGENNAYFGYVFGAQSAGGNISYVPETIREIAINGGERIVKGALYGIDFIEELTLPFLGGYKNDEENTHISFVYGYDTYEGNAYLPSTLKRVTVLSGIIGNEAFCKCKKIEEIILGDDITKLCRCAASDCDNLLNVHISNSLTSIGDSAFARCKKLKTIIIPQSVVELGSYVFADCTSLLSIPNLENFDSITSGLFSGCSKLVSVEIPNGVTKIGSFAFSNCSMLKTITIPNSVINVDENAFYRCDNLEYSIYDGAKYLGNDTNHYLALIETASKSISSCTVHDDTRVISSRAFCECENLVSCIISNSVIDIGSYAFSGCNKLNTIILGDGVLNVSKKAFDGCNSLLEITIPENIKKLGYGTFSNCNNLNKVFFNAVSSEVDIPDFYGYSHDPCFYNSGCSMEVIFGDSVVAIPDFLFYYCRNLESISFGKNIKTIGNYSFNCCDSIKSLDFSNGINTIGSSSFAGCIFLETIDIQNSVSYIGENAFLNCKNIKEVNYYGTTEEFNRTTIAAGNEYLIQSMNIINDANESANQNEMIELILLNNSQFDFISNNTGIAAVKNELAVLTSLDETQFDFISNGNGTCLVSGGNRWLTGNIEIPTKSPVGEKVIGIANEAFSGAKINSIIIPDGVTSIGNYAFDACNTLVSINIPDSVTTIGDCAFRNCTRLSSINIPMNIQYIGLLAFDGCKLTYNEFEGGKYLGNEVCPCLVFVSPTSSSILNCTINENVKVILYDAFLKCSNLKSITIPDGVCSIGGYAFDFCDSLSTICIPNSVTSICVGAFRGCKSLTEIFIPNSVTIIESYAFSDCSSLTEICIPYCVTNIGNELFYGCSSLSTIVIPNSVMHVGSMAFYNCKMLTQITIPNSVTYIGSKAFSECNNLSIITYIGERMEWRFVEKATDWNSGIENIEVEFLPDSGLLFETNDDISEMYISEYDSNIGKLTNLDIPERYAGRPVTSIFKEAFYNNKTLEEINISPSIVTIGNNAFSKCEGLNEITIPETVVYIGNGILSETPIEDLTLSFNSKTLGSKDILVAYLFGAKKYYEAGQAVPKTLKAVHIIGIADVPDYAFYGLEGVEHFDFLGDVKKFGNYIFTNCKSITDIVIPDSVTEIGESICYGCDELKTITLGAKLDTIKDISKSSALFGINKAVSGFDKYIVSNQNKKFCSDEHGVLYVQMSIPYASGMEYIPISVVDAPACANLSNYSLPEHIVEIMPYAFAYNDSVVSVDLSYIRSIGNYAFYENNNLITVNLGEPRIIDSVFLESIKEINYSQYIGNGAFMGCASLQKINIETSNLVGIGEQAFYDCSKLKRVLLGKKIQKIGSRAFGSSYSGASELQEFYVPCENTYFKSIDGVLYKVNDDNSLTLICVPANLVELSYNKDSNGNVISQSAKVQGGNYIYKTDFVLPAFDNNGNAVTIGTIGSYSFQGTKNINNVTIKPQYNIIVGDYAFSGSAIQTVDIGEKVSSLGIKRGEGEYTVFSECPYLTEINVDEKNGFYCSIDGVLFDKQIGKLIKYPASKILTEYTIPDTVSSISSMAFKDNHSLKSVTAKSYISFVGLEAFYNCSNLAVLYFDDVYAPLTIMENAFTTYYNPSTIIGYNSSKHSDGSVWSDYGWKNYDNIYNLKVMNELPDIQESGSEDGDYYAVVIVDESGNRIDGQDNLIVTLTDPSGNEETVFVGKDGIATFYNLYGKVNLGFSVVYDEPYKLEVCDAKGGYYSFVSDEFYLDYETQITYVTLVKKEFPVYFNLNGGEGTVPQNIKTSINNEIDISDCKITRYGYQFGGWSDKPDGEVKYQDRFVTETYNFCYTLYAKWIPNTNTIKFNNDSLDVIGNMEDCIINTDEKTNLPKCNYSKDGYEFLGWSLSKNGTVLYADEDIFVSNGDSEINLYPIWKGNENILMFLPNGGTGNMQSISVVTDMDYNLPKNEFVREGYSFIGWKNEIGTLYSDLSEYKANSSSIQILYAQWVVDVHILSFDSNGGVETEEPLNAESFSEISLPKDKISRDGYMFIGWSETKEGIGICEFEKYRMPAKDVTLYAIWNKLPNIYGLNCNEEDINTQTTTINTAEYGTTYESIELINPNKGYAEDNIRFVGETSERIEISTIVYYDSTNFDVKANEAVLCQNGTEITGCEVVDVEKNTDSVIITYRVPVNSLIAETPIEARAKTLSNFSGKEYISKNFLNIDIINFSVTEDDINLDSSDLSVDLTQGGSSLMSLLGSGSFTFNIGKNVSINTDIEGNKITVTLNAEYSKSKTSNSAEKYGNNYQKGFEALTPNKNHSKNTWQFARYGMVTDDKGKPHFYKMNIWLAKETAKDGYCYYRCSVTENKKIITKWYGAVTAPKKKYDKNSYNFKVNMIYCTFFAEAMANGDITKGFKYIEPVTKASALLKTKEYSTKNSFSATLYGDIVLQYEQGKIVPVTSTIKGEVKYEFTHEQQFVVVIVPVYLDVKVEIDGKVNIELKYDEWRSVSVEEAKMTIEAEINAAVGVGCKIISAGVTGSIGTIFVLHFAPRFGVESWEAHGKFDLYAKYYTLKWKRGWLGLWYPYTTQETATLPLYSFSGYIIDNRGLYEENDLSAQLMSAQLFMADAYEPADNYEEKAQLFMFDGDIYKIGYVNMNSKIELPAESDRESTYDEYNYFKLALSKWEESQSKWILISLLDDNGYNDFEFDICENDYDYQIVFTQQAKKSNEYVASDTYEYVSMVDVKSVSLNDILDKNENAVKCVSQKECYKYLTKIAVVDGIPTVVWVENADNNMFGVSPYNYIDNNNGVHTFETTANSIWYSQFNGSNWTDAVCLKSDLSAIVDLDITNTGYVSYIVDENGNLSDITDRMLYSVNINTKKETLLSYEDDNYVTSVESTTGGIIYSNVIDGDSELVYEKQGKIKENVILPEETIIPDEYKLVFDKNGTLKAILYAQNVSWTEGQNDVSGSVLYGIFYDGETWGKPIEIQTNLITKAKDRYISSFDVICQSNEQMLLILDTVDELGSENKTITDIYAFESNINIVSSDVSYVNKKLHVSVVNKGSNSTALYAVINAGNSVDVYENIISGQECSFEIDLSGFGTDINVELYESVNNKKVGDTICVDLKHSNLTPYVKQLLLGENNTILVAVKNNGNVSSGGKMYVSIGNENKETIKNARSSFNIETLAPGKISYYEVALEGNLTVNEDSVATIYVEEIGTFEKGDALNDNILYTTLNKFSSEICDIANPYAPTIDTFYIQYDTKIGGNVRIGYNCAEKVSIKGIYNGEDSYTIFTDYIVEDGEIVLKEEMLRQFNPGKTKLNILFSNDYSECVEIEIVKYYMIKWDIDGKIFETEVKEGEIPKCPEELTKASSEKLEYTFMGWDSNGDGIADLVNSAAENITYVALWYEHIREYNITWKFEKDDKEILMVESYKYGTVPKYNGTLFAPIGKVFYEWDKEIDIVTNNTIYTAIYSDIQCDDKIIINKVSPSLFASNECVSGDICVDINNGTEYEKNVVVIVGVYLKNQLCCLKMINKQLKTGNNSMQINDILFEKKTEPEYEVRCFVWDSMENMMPLTESMKCISNVK